MKQLFSLLILFSVHCISTIVVVAQSPVTAPTISPPAPIVPRQHHQTPAPAPGPPGPTNITAILEKGGRFNSFIRLLKSTQTANRINDQLNNSKGGLTVFAPTDSAFGSMKNVTLNTLSTQQQSELVQFHILPNYFSLSQFETASDPLSTQAGATNYGQFPLNVSASGNSVNLTTGFSSASISNTLYTDGQLAVYELDHVLLPQRFFVTPPPVPAPAPTPPKPKTPAAKPDDDAAPLNKNNNNNTSDANPLFKKMVRVSYVAALLVAYVLCL